MPLDRWKPRFDYTKQEERLLKRLHKTRKLFAFLRDHRYELFDEAFQAELESMYRKHRGGQRSDTTRFAGDGGHLAELPGGSPTPRPSI
jgi:hypothetical protein